MLIAKMFRRVERLPDVVAARLQRNFPRTAAAVRCIHVDSPLTVLFIIGELLHVCVFILIVRYTPMQIHAY